MIADMLMREADSAEELAEQIIRAIDEKREKDPVYILNYYDPNVKTLVTYGPYGTQNQAAKSVNTLASSGPMPAQAQVTTLRSVHGG